MKNATIIPARLASEYDRGRGTDSHGRAQLVSAEGLSPSSAPAITTERAGEREQQLLLWLCAVGLRHRTQATPASLDGIDWTRVVALARRHRVVPLVWRNLQRRSDVAVPAAATDDLRNDYQQNALHGLRVTSHLIRMVTALAGEGIPALPLKGVCLAARYYGDVSARYAGDIDLLVPSACLARADAVLRGLGYLRVSNKTRTIVLEPFDEDTDFRLHYKYIGRDGVPIELHFQLHNNPDVLAIDTARVVSEGVSVPIGRTTLPAMPDDLQFVFLATHGARHEWGRLQWLCDIAVMLDRARPEDLREWLATAARYSLLNPVVQAMVLAERLLGVALPPEVTRAYAQSRRIRYMVRRAERTMFHSEEGKLDRPHTSFDFGRRLYRMCMTGRPVYLWHELRNGVKAVSARLVKPAASSP